MRRGDAILRDQQHEPVDVRPDTFLATFDAAHDQARRALWARGPEALDGIAWLAAHLATMEHVVYPYVVRRMPDGRGTVRAQRLFSRNLERLLRIYERRITGDVLMSRVNSQSLHDRLAEAMRLHRENEEEMLRSASTFLDVTERRDLVERYATALQHAPSRPHPVAPHRGLLGRIAYRIDMLRDDMREGMDARRAPTHGPLMVPPPLSRWGRYFAGTTSFDRDGDASR